jgi:hypothetical protein
LIANGQAHVGDNTAQVPLDFLLPIRESFAVVDELVVGFKTLLNFGEALLEGAALRPLVHVERHRRHIAGNSGLQDGHSDAEIRRGLEDGVELLVVSDAVTSLFQVRDFLDGETNEMLGPFFLEGVKCNQRLQIAGITFSVVFVKLVKRALNEFATEHLRLTCGHCKGQNANTY